MKYKACLESIRKRDSLILVNPRQHFHAADDKSFRERMVQKYEVFNALIQNDSVSSYDEAIEKYELKRSISSKMAFSTAKGYRKMRRQPGTFISSLISKLPFAVFLFLPVFTLFIWLAYIRKKYNYTDHLIFSFHNTSLLFILLIVSYLIDSILNVNSNWIFVSIFSVYLFWAMRKFYRQKCI